MKIENSTLITKSDIIRAMQCPRQAYFYKFEKELSEETDAYSKMIIERGNTFGYYAQLEFDSATSYLAYDKSDTLEESLLKTKNALENPEILTIFEASFLFNDVYVRIDILNRDKNSQKWNMHEVKSGSDLDDDYIFDAAIQQWVLQQINFPLQDGFLWYVNKKCELPDLTFLFNKEKITFKTQDYFVKIEKTIQMVRELFSNPQDPKTDIGPHCTKPFECPFQQYCHKEKNIPDFSVFNVPRIGKRAYEYYKKGLLRIDQLNPDEGFTKAQAKMINCTNKNLTIIDKNLIEKEISNWEFPLYMIDFEAMEYDLPGFSKTRPGIHTPFQMSIHIWESLEDIDKPLKKIADFLQQDSNDPRTDLAKFIVANIGTKGSVVAYSQSYEKGKLLDMASFIADDQIASRLEEIALRLVDPLPIFREAVYHPEFKGSYSIKKVAPALLGESASYKNLLIKDGTEAVIAFKKMIQTADVKEKNKLIQGLISYCDKDTFVMGELVKWLYRQII